MLACIACSKEGGDDTPARADTPRAVKSLGSQIKDMVLKFSGSSRHCKGGAGSSAAAASYRHRSGCRDVDDVAVSDGGSHYAYQRGGSSSSTPAWDFANNAGAGADVGARRGNEEAAVADEDGGGEAKEWTALVEPGVQITFMSLPGGSGNDLKRIRFSREMFNKWQAQRWWGENFDRIMELYNVQRFSRQALPTPPRSDDGERESFYSRMGSSTRESPATPPFGRTNKTGNRPPPAASSSRAGGAAGGGGGYLPSVPDPSEHILPHHLFHHHQAAVTATTANASSSGIGKGESSSIDASRTTTSSRDEAPSISISNASDVDMTEWVEQDEPGVYITIRELPDGTRELRRVRFSRERFGEVHAKLWWEDNRERIQAQYL
ncbi:protein Brevis radix-like 4 [Iris pallida]|uniref:Protein Brevis radix-like 4 n=1 Tax=Iris pallida TaxID=29817 RepID=A0AAX6IMG7_IRIPA|nr:protein Brevis radix-like 4 [Iris pallida]KAJ6854171.1 protein Brevis radix-like 4 [Iris pallida]